MMPGDDDASPVALGRPVVAAGPDVRGADVVVDAVRFANERGRTPKPWRGRLGELVGETHLERDTKAGTPVFSPVVYGLGAMRGKKGVEQVTALVFDFDHLPEGDSQRLLATLRKLGWAGVGYSSHSHRAGGPDDWCFRLVIAVSRAMLPDEFSRVWQWANAALGGLADTNARDVSRIWYVASCPKERLSATWFDAFDGRLLDVDAALAAAQPAAGERARAAAQRVSRGPRQIGPGGRNAMLTSYAGVMRRRGATEEQLARALLRINAERCRPPLDEAEVRSVAASVAGYPTESDRGEFALTDAGNAERFAAYVDGRFKYDHSAAAWWVYDGRRWRRDHRDERTLAFIEMVRAEAEAVDLVADGDEADELRKHLKRSEGVRQIRAGLQLARSRLPLDASSLDARPELLNVANGVIDLRTLELHPHRAEDLLSRIIDIEHKAEATCPRWDRFVHRLAGNDPEVARYLERFVGYALTGETREHVLLVLHGSGANGKSTFVETVRDVMGEYAMQADFTTFLAGRSGGPRNDIARLAGARFVTASEASADAAFDEAVLKMVTGGDTITARLLYREHFEFRPKFKLCLATNHLPTIRSVGEAMWRRMRIVNCGATVPDTERNPRLRDELREELEGILAWAVRAAAAWYREGLPKSESVDAATRAYRAESDVLGPFFEFEACLDGAARTPVAQLYAAYACRARLDGDQVISNRAFAAALRERGCTPAKGAKGVRYWEGVRLLRPDERT